MNKKILTIVFTLLAIVNTPLLFAQDYTFKDYDWNEKETTIKIPDQYKNQNEVILNRTIKKEILLVSNIAKQYYLLHEKTYINSNDAIERNNKIYIPFSQNEVLISNKARVILQNGKTINLDKKDIKEEVDEEKGVKYNYFAVNGLEKGAVIETIFIMEESPELNGRTIKMQDEYPIANLDFELIYPKHLAFKTKAYNGLSEPKIDTEKLDKKTLITISEKNIPALGDDEKYANQNIQLKMFRYKLDANSINGAKNLYNFKEFATNLFDRYNAELDKKQLKAIEEFSKSIPKSNDLQEQIWNIENKIKKTIAYDKYVDSKESLLDVIKIKQANQSDILRLYVAIFKNFKIENELVFTSNRYKIPFDKDFESYENLSDILLYFPTIKKYITITEIEYRIPMFPSNLASNNGLFIKAKKFAGINMGIGEINFIEIPGTETTHDTMEITMDFTKDIENPTITNKMSFNGYSAINFQAIKDLVAADQYKNILKSVAENYTVQAEYDNLTTENDGLEYIGKKPFLLNVTFQGKSLIQKAGPNYLVSVGLAIGKQSELYQENNRTLPVEIDYPHAYARKIKIILPKGATVKNLEKLVMNHELEINGKKEAAFTSKYQQKDNEINIENIEYYNLTNYSLDNFNKYKEVINAAADFNKIVIILNK
jgi:Domain of Unknown Function with PDB structure (DUF3857)